MFLVLANQLVNTSKTTRVAEQNKKQKKKKKKWSEDIRDLPR